MPATKTVGAYEAKTKLPELLDLVAHGDEIVITRHERPVARLVPVDRPVAREKLFGRLRGLRSSLKLRKGETTKDLIAAGRRV
jgi:prevent-host-death family protein